jgi:hypothetical protein
MPPSRVDAIRQILAAQPNDPFPRYGLAMELKNLKRFDEARAEFDELERRFPDYVPQYLMHLNMLVEMKQIAAARALGARGLEAARRKGDMHALGELQGAVDGLEYADE